MRVLGVGGVLLSVLLPEARLQHGDDLERGGRQRHDEGGAVVQHNGAYGIKIQDDGARAREDGSGAVEFAVNDADVAAGEACLHLERAAVEVAQLVGAAAAGDGLGVEGWGLQPQTCG